MSKIITLGEIMLRLSPSGQNVRFVQADRFDVIYGGGEANVAVSCANYGHHACFVSKLPAHEDGTEKGTRISGICFETNRRGRDVLESVCRRKILPGTYIWRHS